MNVANHYDHMKLALTLAEQGRYTVSPNPMVGCVIVKDRQIIGEGFHQYAGLAHAEIEALKQAGERARDATMYVTLEPCCHVGRTPPCTDAIIKAGIKKIYASCCDPNPLMSGKGYAALQAAGIEVITHLCEQEALALNKVFFHFIRTKRPYVIAKWAMSLDGKTVTHPQDSRDISSEQSQKMNHTIRQQVDAVLIGANTAVADNPKLTVRHACVDKQPLRIILSSNGKLPTHLSLFRQDLPGVTMVATTNAISTTTLQTLRQSNARILIVPADSSGQVDLRALLTELGEQNISSILVEGGMQIINNFFNQQLVNEVQVYLAPLIIGTMPKKQRLNNINLTPVDRDFYLTSNVESNDV